MDLARTYPHAQVPGLTWQRMFARPDPGLGFAAIRRRLARGHLSPNASVLAGERAGSGVVVSLVERVVGHDQRDAPIFAPRIVVDAEIDPPLFAGAAVVARCSMRFPEVRRYATHPDADRLDVPVRSPELAGAFHASAADRDRLDAFLGPSRPDDDFPGALARVARGLGDVCLTDGLVEVNAQPEGLDLVATVEAAVMLARLASARVASLPDSPGAVAFKAGWAELASKRALAFDPLRARAFGTLGDHLVELAVEPAYHHVETCVDLRFARPLDSPFQLEPSTEAPETWLTRLFAPRPPGHLRIGGLDVTLDPVRRAEPLFARGDVRTALARLEELGVVVAADASSITTRAHAALDGPAAEELLEATLALGDALTASRAGALPYR